MQGGTQNSRQAQLLALRRLGLGAAPRPSNVPQSDANAMAFSSNAMPPQAPQAAFGAMGGMPQGMPPRMGAMGGMPQGLPPQAAQQAQAMAMQRASAPQGGPPVDPRRIARPMPQQGAFGGMPRRGGY